MVDKPAGLLSVPGRGAEKADCVESRLSNASGWLRAVHRLDMDTSGLLILARTPEAHRSMSEAFAARSIEKTYEAHVWGVPDAARGRVDVSIVADWPNRPRQMVDPVRGKPAITDWQCLGKAGNTAHLVLRPVTGRSHQLRVHMAHIGHPILGDPFYAHPAARAAAPRLMLHAAALAFDHPVTGARLELRLAPPFPALASALAQD
ncbi:MAG: RluA family pseudouridine synthase [Pseudomonadota bacterium]